MATPTRVKVDNLLRYTSVDREIRRENPNYTVSQKKVAHHTLLNIFAQG